MALTVVWQQDNVGLVLPGAYVRVNQVNLKTMEKRGHITIGVYVDAATRREGKAPADVREYTLTERTYDTWFAAAVLDAVNPVRQSYLFLREQPAFADAIDV